MASGIPIYIAFINGVLHYVCPECTALCCRGQGFAGNVRREIPELLEKYPQLGVMATGRQGDIVYFNTPTGRCFFLEHDNRCRIENEHGKRLKPGVCGLFPFNNLSVIGDTLVVAPHFLCPLRVQLPPRPGAVAGTHSEVAQAVLDSGLIDGPGATVPRNALAPGADPTDIVRREISFRDRCAQALGEQRFSDVLAAAADDADRLSNVTSRARQVLGLPEPVAARDDLDDLLLVLASPLRLALLKLPSDTVLATLSLAEGLLRRAATIGDNRLTPQGAYGVIRPALPALAVLARGDVRLQVPADGPPYPGTAEQALTFGNISRALHRNEGLLTSCERWISADTVTADRMTLLLHLAGFLEHVVAKQ